MRVKYFHCVLILTINRLQRVVLIEKLKSSQQKMVRNCILLLDMKVTCGVLNIYRTINWCQEPKMVVL
jgi:hypothetical protein